MDRQDGGKPKGSSAMFDTMRFITEIERRPVIYSISSKGYNDKEAKITAWDEICKIMVPKWSTLSDEEQINEEKILKGKWRNIRDYFMKELKAMKLGKRRLDGRKRKKYVDFDKLLFLLPNVQNKKSRKRTLDTLKRSNDEVEESVPEAEDNEEPMMEEYEMPLTHESGLEDSNETENHKAETITFKYVTALPFPKSMCETTMPTATVNDYSEIRTIRSENDDYDRMFLLSLLPIMRRVPEDKKLDVRIKMQQALASAIPVSPSSNK